MELLKNAWRNIFRRPSRSLLTILSIAIGAFSVMAIGTIGQLGQQAVTAELSSLGLQGMLLSAEGEAALTRECLSRAEEVPQVAEATPLLVNYTDILVRGSEEKAVVWGVDADVTRIISMNLLYGRGITAEDIRSGARVCVVEETLAREMYLRDNVVGKTLTVLLNGQEEEFTVVGVAEAGGSLFQSMMGETVPLFAYTPYTAQQQCTGRGDFDRIAVKLRADADPVQAEDQLSRSLGGEVKVENMSRYTNVFSSILNIVTLVLAAIAGISLLVACLSVMTAMLCSVGERTREIGVKKSIGASSRDIVWEFLLEAVLLSLAGGLAGIAAGAAAGWAGCLALGMAYRFPAGLALTCGIASLLAGAVFGAYPARRAAKLKPVDALRTE